MCDELRKPIIHLASSSFIYNSSSYCPLFCRFVVSCIPSWFWGPVVTLEDCLAAFFAADELKGEFSSVGSDSMKQGEPPGGVFHVCFGGGLHLLDRLPQCFT